MLATPSCNVRYKDVGSEVQLRFHHDPPSTWAVDSVVEGSTEQNVESTSRPFVPSRRPRTREELAVDELTHEMFRQLHQVLVCRYAIHDRHAVMIPLYTAAIIRSSHEAAAGLRMLPRIGAPPR